MNNKKNITKNKIEATALALLKRTSYDQLNVKMICLKAGINRSTFYAYYDDINDLIMSIEEDFSNKIFQIWQQDATTPYVNPPYEILIAFFKFVKEHQYFYQAFLNSSYPSFTAQNLLSHHREYYRKMLAKENITFTDKELEYHLYFFGGGLKGISGLWLQNNCQETPEELAKIISNEYNIIKKVRGL